MKYKHIILLLILAFTSFSCEKFLDVNENPNQLVEVPSGDLLLKGTLLANTQLHKGHLMRSAAYYTGSLIGNNLVQQTIYLYSFTPGDSNASWEHFYNGILVQNKKIRNLSPELDALQGVIDVNEAMALGTAASLWGAVPYSSAVPDNPTLESATPSYDSQSTVFGSVQSLLDAGITKIGNSTTSVGDEDIFNGGDKTMWTEAAYTLKARNYMLVGDYNAALGVVDKGVSSPDNSTQYHPIGSVSENSNLLFNLVNSSRAGDMTGEDAYLQQILDPANTDSRNNAKTDESARRNYLYVSGDGATANGIDAQATPMPLVTYEENLLIWAECLARTGDNTGALTKLNELRTYLSSGNAFNLINADDTFKYDAYEMSDFESGGIE
ncbi:MAG: SusD/RagB family nutrient-binding outer membrane lipoprotein, partial [Chitinophagales bacterium]